MTDLTKITTPFGLLDKDTQDALKAAFETTDCIEVYTPAGWKSPTPQWNANVTYRAKPEPVRVERLLPLYRAQGCRFTSGCHRVTCNEDGTDPTVTWEPST